MRQITGSRPDPAATTASSALRHHPGSGAGRAKPGRPRPPRGAPTRSTRRQLCGNSAAKPNPTPANRQKDDDPNPDRQTRRQTSPRTPPTNRRDRNRRTATLPTRQLSRKTQPERGNPVRTLRGQSGPTVSVVLSRHSPARGTKEEGRRPERGNPAVKPDGRRAIRQERHNPSLAQTTRSEKSVTPIPRPSSEYRADCCALPPFPRLITLVPPLPRRRRTRPGVTQWRRMANGPRVLDSQLPWHASFRLHLPPLRKLIMHSSGPLFGSGDLAKRECRKLASLPPGASQSDWVSRRSPHAGEEKRGRSGDRGGMPLLALDR